MSSPLMSFIWNNLAGILVFLKKCPLWSPMTWPICLSSVLELSLSYLDIIQYHPLGFIFRNIARQLFFPIWHLPVFNTWSSHLPLTRMVILFQSLVGSLVLFLRCSTPFQPATPTIPPNTCLHLTFPMQSSVQSFLLTIVWCHTDFFQITWEI